MEDPGKMGQFSDRINLKNGLCAIAFCSLLFSSAIGQVPSTSEIVHLDLKGLPAVPIRCLVKDRDGFLWIGTDNGLCRYDGFKVDVYRTIPGDSMSLPGNKVSDLLQDRDGRIGAATFLGGCVFDPHTMPFERKAVITSTGTIGMYECLHLLMDDQGRLWACDNTTAFARYDKRKGAFLEIASVRAISPKSGSSARFSDAVQDSSGTFWIAEVTALIRYDPLSDSVRAFAFRPNGDAPPLKTLFLGVHVDPHDGRTLWITASFVSMNVPGHSPNTCPRAKAHQTSRTSCGRWPPRAMDAYSQASTKTCATSIRAPIASAHQ